MFTHSIRGVECAREVRAHGELFCFLIQKEPASMSGSETFSPFLNADIRTPFFSADVLEECALFALHLIAEEGRGGEDGCHAPDLEDERKLGSPKSPMRESEGEAWSEDRSVSSSDSRDSNVCNEALHVTGLYGLGDKVSLEGLGAGNGGIELSHGPGHAVPGNA